MNRVISIIIFFSFTFSESIKYRLTPQQNQKIRQAKTLQRNGLNEEAKNIYFDLFNESPFLKEAFYPLKKILKNEEDFKTLEKIYPLYLESNNNSISSKIDVIDILIWIKNEKWKSITIDIINNQSAKEKNLKSLFNILLKNSKNIELEKYLNDIRKNKDVDFFSYELGMHYAMEIEVEKSINEFLLHLDHNKSSWKYNIVRNKILSFPDINNINKKIESILINHKSDNAKLILADVAFKNKNFVLSYELLKKYSNDENKLLEFIDSLIKNKEYELAQNIINDIINSDYNSKIVQGSIIKLAEIYEILLKKQEFNLPISSSIYKNQILDSPFIKINSKNSLLLESAITIYDSLMTNNKNLKSIYNLAQIKYKILGDLDSSYKLFNNVISNSKITDELHSKAIIEMINIMISKGELLKAKAVLKKSREKIELIDLFLIKEIQILFYLNEWEELNDKIDFFLKSDYQNIVYYNDVLKLKSYLAIFESDKEQLKNYTKAQMKKFQNKRYDAIRLINQLSESNNLNIASNMKYEHAHLLVKQNNFQGALDVLDTISSDNYNIETSILFKAEIYDFILNDTSNAVDLYLFLLENFPDNIYYDSIRLRLREITS
ncbi:MAG: hypothetical protein CMG39_06240 [Candidatus Marinimicrobia bacterium]|nr:hypothetical protein [Candidatus Neomarinimicrobiota bacterium]